MDAVTEQPLAREADFFLPPLDTDARDRLLSTLDTEMTSLQEPLFPDDTLAPTRPRSIVDIVTAYVGPIVQEIVDARDWITVTALVLRIATDIAFGPPNGFFIAQPAHVFLTKAAMIANHIFPHKSPRGT